MKKQGHFFDIIYGVIYSFGDVFRRGAVAVFNVLRKGLNYVIKSIARFFAFIFSFLKRSVNHIKTGLKHFKEIIASSKISDENSENEKKKFNKRLFFSALSTEIKKQKGVGKAILNTAAGVLAIVMLISFSIAMNNLTFAVRVKLNGDEIGIAEDEATYKEAEKSAIKRLSHAGEKFEIKAPEYSLTVTTIDNINNSQELCDSIISKVCDKTIRACGIYVNDVFVCAVKSEDTYKRVSKAVIDDYISQNSMNSSDITVEFNEKIECINGLYPENEKIMSAKELEDFMKGYKSEPIEYVVGEGDDIDKICQVNNIKKDELLKLNPSLEEDNIPEGSTLLIKKGEKSFSIKSTVTRVKLETSPFETVMQYDSNLSYGTKSVLIAGVPGRDIVSYVDTFIDGVKVSSDVEKVRYNANSPTNQLMRVGVRGTAVNDDSIPVSPRLWRDQGGTFIWPAPDNCFWLSQNYKEGQHRGIDIVSSNDGSCKGRRIVAVADGVVVMATYHYSWGYYIRIDHGSGVVTGYAHALEGSFRVNVGDYVKKGQHISSIGTTGNSTGYHLHFEVWLDGVRVNPLPYVYSYYYGLAAR